MAHSYASTPVAGMVPFNLGGAAADGGAPARVLIESLVPSVVCVRAEGGGRGRGRIRGGHRYICAGMTAVDAAEDKEAEAMAVNCEGPAAVAAAAAAAGVRVVYYSTECAAGAARACHCGGGGGGAVCCGC